MSRFDLRALPRDSAGQLPFPGWGGADTSHGQNSNDTLLGGLSFKGEVRRKIFNYVLDSGGAVTRLQIAQALGYKKTPWFVGMIEELAESGYLTRLSDVWKNGVTVYRYDINLEVFKTP